VHIAVAVTFSGGSYAAHQKTFQERIRSIVDSIFYYPKGTQTWQKRIAAKVF
jgi:hypothetical protein